MFRDAGWPKLLTMLGFLVVLGLVFVRARDPATWQWLTEMQEPAEDADAVAEAPPGDAAAEPVTEGPTDEDPDQQFEAEQDFQAVTDGALYNQETDSFAYWRVMLWAEHQSFADLWKRATPMPRYNELDQFPAKHRGELMRFDMHVLRVLPFDAPADCPIDVERLYEIWGFTEQSKNWPVCVVVARVPEGIPVGEKVLGRARFAGYFLKQQGYRDGTAKARDPLSRAPLFLGRIRPILLSGAAAPTWDFSWVLPAGGALLLLFGAAAAWSILRSRRARRNRSARPAPHNVDLNAWLDRGNTPRLDDDEAAEEDWDNDDATDLAEAHGRRGDALGGRPSDNGHNRSGLPTP
jgi:hypothetical protein